MVATTAGNPAAELDPLREAGVEVLELGDDEVDLAGLVDELAGRGLPRLLCEGGPHLHRDLLAAGLVDELSLTLAPVVVGGDGPRTTTGDELPGTPGLRPAVRPARRRRGAVHQLPSRPLRCWIAVWPAPPSRGGLMSRLERCQAPD